MNNIVAYNKSRDVFVRLSLLTAFVSYLWGVFDGILLNSVVTFLFFVCFLFFYVKYKCHQGIFTSLWQDNFITILLLCLFANFLSSKINRGQNIIDSLQTEEVKNMLFIFFFYVLLQIKCNIIELEKTLITLYFIFITCFYLQYVFFYPTPVFKMIGVYIGNIGDIGDEHRFRMISQMIGFIGYFYLLNRILLNRNVPKYYYFGAVLGFFFIVLLGFRVETFSAIICSLYMIYRLKRNKVKMIGTIILFSIAVMMMSQISIVQDQINNMIARHSNGQTWEHKDYIRNVQLYYFMNEHSINAVDYFLGSGFPSGASKYGRVYTDKSTVVGKHGEISILGMYGWWDWGLIGLSWMGGLPLVLSLYGFIIYMIFKNYGKRNLYISAAYLFFLLTSVTTIEFYRQGAYVYHAFILYITFHLERNNRIKEKLSDIRCNSKKMFSTYEQQNKIIE